LPVYSADRLPVGLLRAMRFAVANAYELYHLREPSDETALDFVCYRNEMAMLTTLQQLITSRINKLGGSDAAKHLADDRRTLLEQKDTLSWNAINAIRYRIGQRHVLISSLALTRTAMHHIAAQSTLSRTPLAPALPSAAASSSNVAYEKWLAESKSECALSYTSPLPRVLGTPVVTNRAIPIDGTIASFAVTSLLSAATARASPSFAAALELIQGNSVYPFHV
jgi:hypothetical protein